MKKGETPLQLAKKQKLDDFIPILSNYMTIMRNESPPPPSITTPNNNMNNTTIVSSSSLINYTNTPPTTCPSTSLPSSNNLSIHNNNPSSSSSLITSPSSSILTSAHNSITPPNDDEENIWDIIKEGIKLSENLEDKLSGLSIKENTNKVALNREEEEELLLSPLVFESDTLQVISYRYPDHFTHKFGDLDYATRVVTIHFVLESTLLTEHLISKLQGKFNIGNEFKLTEHQVPTRKITIKYQVSKEIDLNTLKTSITDIHSKIGNDIKPLRYLLLIFSKNRKLINLEETTIDLN